MAMGNIQNILHLTYSLTTIILLIYISEKNTRLRQGRDKCFTLEDSVCSILSIIYLSQINGCNGSFLKLRTVEFSLMKVRLKPVDCFSSDSCSALASDARPPPLPLPPSSLPPVIANPKSPTPSPHPRTRCIELKAVFVIASTLAHSAHTQHQ